MIFGLQNEREWVTFCAKVLERPELATDPRFRDNNARREHRRELTGLIEDYFCRYDLDRGGEEAGCGRHRQRSAERGPGDVWEHVQFTARDRWREVNTPGGPVRACCRRSPSPTCEAAMGDVPALGQHTDAVLQELGYAPAEIDAFRAAGAV